MSTPRLKLYFSPGSSSLAAHVALNEANAAFEATPILLARGDQRQPDYLALCPLGRVPALWADGVVITENIAILSYIAQRFEAARLLPQGAPLRTARAYELMSWYATALHGAIAQIWRTERITQDETLWPVLKRDGQIQIERAFADIERLLDPGPWMLGANYSVLDAYTLVFWRWGERLQLDMARHSAWSAHTTRMQARPAVAAALAAERGALDAAAPFAV